MPAPSPPLLVACLCAEWCSACREYRATFDQVAAEFNGAVRFIWIDIEDEAELVDPIEVETFPTLLIADAGAPRFFGPLTPQPGARQSGCRGAGGQDFLSPSAFRIFARVCPALSPGPREEASMEPL